MDRRTILRSVGLAFFGLLSAKLFSHASCINTKSNPQGPLYIPGAPFTNKLNDVNEPGKPLVVTGRVFSSINCEPIADAVLDVWHANSDGVYYGLEASSKGIMEQGLLRARVTCDERGQYSFSTILPGHYRVSRTRFRARHIHVIFGGAGHTPAVTQLYFPGDQYFQGDPLARRELVMEINESGKGLLATFDFYI